MASETGRIFDIKRYAVHDGPGIRTTVFFQGCPLSCWWCHNPEGLRAEGEAPPPDILEGLDDRTCGKLAGRTVSVEQVMETVRRDTLFYEESGGGVTFSGGEPLAQPEFLAALLRACRAEGLHTAVDTSGYADEEIAVAIASLADLILFDIKILDDHRHREFTGVSNGPILRNLRRLDALGVALTLRFPVVPTITDSDDNLRRLADLLGTLKNARDICLLPFHKMARDKYERMGMENRIATLSPPTAERLDAIRRLFADSGWRCAIGG